MVEKAAQRLQVGVALLDKGGVPAVGIAHTAGAGVVVRHPLTDPRRHKPVAATDEREHGHVQGQQHLALIDKGQLRQGRRGTGRGVNKTARHPLGDMGRYGLGAHRVGDAAQHVDAIGVDRRHGRQHILGRAAQGQIGLLGIDGTRSRGEDQAGAGGA